MEAALEFRIYLLRGDIGSTGRCLSLWTSSAFIIWTGWECSGDSSDCFLLDLGTLMQHALTFINTLSQKSLQYYLVVLSTRMFRWATVYTENCLKIIRCKLVGKGGGEISNTPDNLLKAFKEKIAELPQYDTLFHTYLFIRVFKCIVDALRPCGVKTLNQTV